MHRGLTAGALCHQDKDSYFHPFTSVRDQQSKGSLVITRGEGLHLWDASGNRYIDAAAGLWCVNVGYGRAEISNAIHEQSLHLPYYHSFNAMGNEPSILLSERLLKLAPKHMRRVFYGLSGSDANDTAIKLLWYFNIARGRPQKRKIIARRFGYHGVTVASGSLSGLPMVQSDFGLPLEFAKHVSRPDVYRDMEERGCVTEEEYSQVLANELDDLIQREGADTVAGFIAEPVMGTGGVYTPPAGYFELVKAVLDHHDVALIADEVITGFGRIGTWFASERFGLEPDLIVTAKGLTSGYLPLSAVLVGSKIWEGVEAVSQDGRIFGHGFTYSGHPTCAAAAMANIDILERENLLASVKKLGPYLLQQLINRCGDLAVVGHVRGAGLMAGVELVADRKSKRPFDPAAKIARRVAIRARERGILVRGLPNSNVVAVSPPFTATTEIANNIAQALADAISDVSDEVHREGLI